MSVNKRTEIIKLGDEVVLYLPITSKINKYSTGYLSISGSLPSKYSATAYNLYSRSVISNKIRYFDLTPYIDEDKQIPDVLYVEPHIRFHHDYTSTNYNPFGSNFSIIFKIVFFNKDDLASLWKIKSYEAGFTERKWGDEEIDYYFTTLFDQIFYMYNTIHIYNPKPKNPSLYVDFQLDDNSKWYISLDDFNFSFGNEYKVVVSFDLTNTSNPVNIWIDNEQKTVTLQPYSPIPSGRIIQPKSLLSYIGVGSIGGVFDHLGYLLQKGSCIYIRDFIIVKETVNSSNVSYYSDLVNNFLYPKRILSKK